jgi:hypothetical protein
MVASSLPRSIQRRTLRFQIGDDLLGIGDAGLVVWSVAHGVAFNWRSARRSR